eukprot:Gregarina_sp_Pseudo_9__1188@NODE_1783_length_1333_cov_97_996909_g1652_i0_p2_GENE_NODE_1783_length_1333_cov_97_996909_g1652_i0NODE_1783_length_1333_cov_97_996909_g1652_i0_p2_ORF_typecomplete_len172_score58_19_NODE_1783_length_1333_cov_97_996909_g1652_i08171257
MSSAECPASTSTVPETSSDLKVVAEGAVTTAESEAETEVTTTGDEKNEHGKRSATDEAVEAAASPEAKKQKTVDDKSTEAAVSEAPAAEADAASKKDDAKTETDKEAAATESANKETCATETATAQPPAAAEPPATKTKEKTSESA